MREHDSVVLTRDLSEHGLKAGDVGAIVHVYKDAAAFEVEFIAGSGEALAVATLEPGDIRALATHEILHARALSA